MLLCLFVSEGCFFFQHPNSKHFYVGCQIKCWNISMIVFYTRPLSPKKKQPAKAITKKTAEGEGTHISCNFQALSVGVDTTFWVTNIAVATRWNQKKNVQQLQGTTNPSSESLYFASCEPLLVLKLVIFGVFLPWEFERHDGVNIIVRGWRTPSLPLFPRLQPDSGFEVH